MRAIRISEHGGPDVLETVELDTPSPGVGEVLIRTTAVGVNYIDTYLRQGTYPRDLPFIPGNEGSGVIEQIGEDTRGLLPGDRVAWCQVPGSYAEYVVAPAEALVAVPDEISDEVAASMLLQGLTAHYLITDTHRALGGDTVLITAGAGGVGRPGEHDLKRRIALRGNPERSRDRADPRSFRRDRDAHHVRVGRIGIRRRQQGPAAGADLHEEGCAIRRLRRGAERQEQAAERETCGGQKSPTILEHP